MSHNIFGHLFRVTSWGESHGPAIGCVIDGCPPKIHFTLSEIEQYLAQRRGGGAYVTPREEPDKLQLLSGALAQCDQQDSFITLGTPLCFLLENKDKRPQDYHALRDIYRPGHADYSYQSKYGIRDVAGGGRASARESAIRVIAGAIARKIIPFVKIRGALLSIGPHEICRERWDWQEVKNNAFFCPDRQMVPVFASYIEQLKKEGDSAGAVIEIWAEDVPKGLGAPLYGKLDQDIASLFMSLNAVKAVEIGAGLAAARRRGSENRDEMRYRDGQLEFINNNAGGILGGIATGAPIIIRFALKPTSSIALRQQTIDNAGNNREVVISGRHDPCVGIRAVAIGEAMLACVLADHYLRHRGQIGEFI